MKKKVVFRADGSATIGYGHLYRMIALSQMIHKEFDCCFIAHTTPGFLVDELKLLDIKLIKVDTIDYPHPDERKKGDEVAFDMDNLVTQGEIVITDGYWFGPQYQQAIKTRGCNLVCIDDLAESEFVADVVINHAPGITQSDYSKKSNSQLCLGLKYILLRKAFLDFARNNRDVRVNESINTIFICIGATDPQKITGTLISEILKYKQVKKIIVLGKNDLLFDTGLADVELNYYFNISPEEIISLIKEADLVIASASTISLEACAVGAPLITIQTAKNQAFIHTGLLKSRASAALDIAQPHGINTLLQSLDVDTRRSMLSAQKELVDGMSPERIHKILDTL